MPKRVQMLLIAVMAGLLAGCGFQPLHDEGFGSARAMVAEIEISPIPDRLGQITRNRLVERFGSSVIPDYRLDVQLTDRSRQFGFRGDNPVTGAAGDAAKTQEQVLLTADFQLIDIKTGDVVMADRVNTSASYDIVLSDFANVTQREDTTRRLALQAVDTIELRLGVFFKRRKEGLDAVPHQPEAQQQPIIEPIDDIPPRPSGGFSRPLPW